MSIRTIGRNFMIDGAVALGLDAWMRRRQRRRMRRSGSALARVMLLHGSRDIHAAIFRRQLLWAREHFNLIDFATFKRLWSNPDLFRSGDPRPPVLLTFDDGLVTNYEVAAPLLEEIGTRGVFFIVPRFSECGGEEARRFYLDQMHGATDEPWQPMTPTQLRDLADRGHTIGAHTWSHQRLSAIPKAEYVREILGCADLIESWIGRPVEAFAWTFSYNSITPAAHQMVCQRYPFCFSPCPGIVDPGGDTPQLIWRTNVETWYRPAAYRFMYSGLADRLWAARRDELRNLLLDSHNVSS
jgi:peptidoglycan/xylan/chitin deacetylase (PgdA/CDA1 family)